MFVMQLCEKKMATNKKKIGTDSISYQIIQKITWGSRRKCTQADLANKIGVSKTQMERYERGIDCISVEKLCAIAKTLSVDITALLPESTESYVENNSEGEKMLHLMKR
jgi:DNA-binding XRE family transcriptional regulator